jgi:ribosomal protein S18 acetylase RimI-like enzyme
MHIELITEATEELQAAASRLVPQLTSKPPPTESELDALIHSESSLLLVARGDGGSIVGMACVTVYRVPTGVRAIIEDIVVDQSARGQGIGEALTRECLGIARAKGAAAVTLTSNPGREAANRLYVRMGFARRDTNDYIYRFS